MVANLLACRASPDDVAVLFSDYVAVKNSNVPHLVKLALKSVSLDTKVCSLTAFI